MLSPKEIKKRYKIAQTKKEQWRSIYEEAYEFCLPMRNLYDGYYEMDSTPGQDKMKRVFDSTAIHSTSRFANRIQSALFPPQQQWCRLSPGTDVPEENKIEAQKILDFYAEKMFSVMNQSGFDLALGEFLLDLAIGTACMLIQPGSGDIPIKYTSIPLYQITFDEGMDGDVGYVYRKYKRPFEVIQQEYPDGNIPDELTKKYAEKPQANVELLEVSYKKDNIVYYCVQTMEGDHKIVSRKLKSMPFVVSRYMVVSGEVYGRGPCLYALPDIKTLNKVMELTLKNASLSIGGVFTAVDDGVLNPQTIKIQPGAIIGVSSNGGGRGPSLAPLPRSGDPNLSQIQANELRMAIKKALLDEGLPPDTGNPRTALEIQQRMKELSQNLGSAFGRLINETMFPIVRRTLQLMDEMGMIELPLKIDGLQVTINPVSELAMANNMAKLQPLLQYMQMAQGLGPSGMMALKQENIASYILDMMGIDARLRNTPQEIQQQQQMMMQQAQAAMQQQAMAQGGAPPGEPPPEG